MNSGLILFVKTLLKLEGCERLCFLVEVLLLIVFLGPRPQSCVNQLLLLSVDDESLVLLELFVLRYHCTTRFISVLSGSCHVLFYVLTRIIHIPACGL